MPPKQKNVPDLLSEAEEELFKIAVRLDSAVRRREQHREMVDDSWFEQCFDEELVCILLLFMAQLTK
jgi:hypothetical protein